MRMSRMKGKLPSALDPKGNTTTLWWEASKAELAKIVFASATYLADRQKRRVASNLHHLRVYSNRLASSLNGAAFSESAQTGDRIKLNATKSAIDAAVAQIATNQPGVMHLTTGGSYEQRKRAERLDKYVMGWFHELQLYVAWLGVFLDACIDGMGTLKFLAKQNGKIGIERVRSDSIFVDDNEMRALVPGTPPRFMFEMRPVSRSVLLANPRFKKFTEEIKGAQFIESAHGAYVAIDDPVTVTEAWKMTTPGSPGRHVICLSSVVMLDEPWSFEKPPFVFFRWNDAPIGFYGIGAVEEVLPIQIELNYLAQKLQRLLHFATSVIWKEKGSLNQAITNDDWAVYEYSGKVPQATNMQAASAEYYNQIDRLYRIVYEILGVSQMSATGAKPAGLYSGEAIRLYHDVATRRYRHTEQRGAQFFIDCDEQIQDRAREVVKRGWGTATTLGLGDKDVEQLDWSDVAMEKDMFVMRTRPVSIIPSEPAGKAEFIKSMAPIAPQLAPYLLGSLGGIPDLEAVLEKANAPQAYAERVVSNIVEHGRYEPPDDVADLDLLRREAQATVLTAPENGIAPARVTLLRRLIAQVDDKQAAEALQQLMMAQGGGPPGAGGAPGGGGLPGAPPIPPQQIAAGVGSAPDFTPPGSATPGLT